MTSYRQPQQHEQHAGRDGGDLEKRTAGMVPVRGGLSVPDKTLGYGARVAGGVGGGRETRRPAICILARHGGPRAEFVELGREEDDRVEPAVLCCAGRVRGAFVMPQTLTRRISVVAEMISRLAHSRAADILAESRAIVKDLIDARRNRGVLVAFDEVGRATGLSARRIKALHYGEVSAADLSAHEVDALRAAQHDHFRVQLAQAEHRVAQLRARLGDGLPLLQGAGVVHATA